MSYLLSTDDIPINREIPSVESRYEHNSNTYDICISILFIQWKPLNWDASGLGILSRLSGSPG